MERIRALSRRAREAGDPARRAARGGARLDLERQAQVLRAFALYFQLANLAEQHHRLRRRREYEPSGASRASRSRRRSRARASGRSDELRARRARRLARARAHGAPDRGDAAHDPRGPCADRRAARRARRPARRRASARRSRPARRGDHRPLADGRGARAAAARRRRDPPRALVLRAEPDRRGASARSPTYRAPRPRGAAAAALRHAGSAATWTATRPSAAETIGEALERARALALARYRDEVRELAAALGARALARVRLARSSWSRSRATSASCRLRGRDRRPERGRAVPPQAVVRLAAAGERRVRVADGARRPTSTSIDRSLRANGGGAHRRRPARGAAAPRRDLRLPPREARRARPRRELAQPTSVRATRSTRVARARERHGPKALDTVVVSGTTSAADVLARRSTLTRRAALVVPLFETIDDLARRAGDRRASCSTAARARRRARRPRSR